MAAAVAVAATEMAAAVAVTAAAITAAAIPATIGQGGAGGERECGKPKCGCQCDLAKHEVPPPQAICLQTSRITPDLRAASPNALNKVMRRMSDARMREPIVKCAMNLRELLEARAGIEPT
jgi:hypothetical protein